MSHVKIPKSEAVQVQKWEVNMVPLESLVGFRAWYRSPQDPSQSLVSPWYAIPAHAARDLVEQLQAQLVVIDGIAQMQGQSKPN